MGLTKRVEVLFDPQKYVYLEEIARRENTTVGELIREAVDRLYVDPAADQRRAAAAWLTEQNFDFGGDWEHVKEEMGRRRYQSIMGPGQDEAP